MTHDGRHDQKRAAMAANLAEQSGRSLEDWVELVDRADVEGFMELVGWLKETYGLGHFQARLVAEAHRDRPS